METMTGAPAVGAPVLSDPDAARGHVHGICLKTGPPAMTGVELEWLVRDARDPALPVAAGRIATAVAGFGADRDDGERGHSLPVQPRPYDLPSGATLTAEPGGQLEVSSAPSTSLAACVTAVADDMSALRAAAADSGLELAGYGLDPVRKPRRVLGKPRYAAMEAYFDRAGPWGRQMMCSTASVQVCVDAGDDSAGTSGYRWRWRLLHAIGPVLVAAFANSPLREGRASGWRSTRQQVWSRLDAGRTRPVDGGGDLREEWARYALDAQVLCVPGPETSDWSAPPGLTFGEWLTSARPRPVTEADLTYHLTTLFPPVRPRGHLELRMIDAQRGDDWIVPLAVVAALADDEQASQAAMAACDALTAIPDRWTLAARGGPADPRIARASRECFAAASGALARMGVPPAISDAVGEFTQRYVRSDRCPADDILEGIT